MLCALGMVVLGVGLICLIFMLIVLWSGVKAVWNSLNRLFNSMGQATGGVMLSPGTAAIATIDLNKRYIDPWLGDMRARTIKEYRGDVPILPSDSAR